MVHRLLGVLDPNNGQHRPELLLPRELHFEGDVVDEERVDEVAIALPCAQQRRARLLCVCTTTQRSGAACCPPKLRAAVYKFVNQLCVLSGPCCGVSAHTHSGGILRGLARQGQQDHRQSQAARAPMTSSSIQSADALLMTWQMSQSSSGFPTLSLATPSRNSSTSLSATESTTMTTCVARGRAGVAVCLVARSKGLFLTQAGA